MKKHGLIIWTTLLALTMLLCAEIPVSAGNCDGRPSFAVLKLNMDGVSEHIDYEGMLGFLFNETGKYDVLSSDRVTKKFKVVGVASACLDSDCAKTAAGQIEVDNVIFGSLEKNKQGYRISLTLLDMKSGTLKTVEKKSEESDVLLPILIEEVVSELTSIDMPGVQLPQALENHSIAPLHGNIENMVYIPAGEFVFGSNDNDLLQHLHLPETKVSLDAFYIDKTQVTNAQFRDFRPDFVFSAGEENMPVVNVSWYDAAQYAKWAGKRLPTEQEWEKAARGADGRRYIWGDEYDASKCNTHESGIGGLTEVGSLSECASPFGVLDMCGNVWEWTATKVELSGDKEEGLGQKEAVIIRGGAWNCSVDYATTFSRILAIPEKKINFIGFRCVKDAR